MTFKLISSKKVMERREIDEGIATDANVSKWHGAFLFGSFMFLSWASFPLRQVFSFPSKKVAFPFFGRAKQRPFCREFSGGKSKLHVSIIWFIPADHFVCTVSRERERDFCSCLTELGLHSGKWNEAETAEKLKNVLDAQLTQLAGDCATLLKES